MDSLRCMRWWRVGLALAVVMAAGLTPIASAEPVATRRDAPAATSSVDVEQMPISDQARLLPEVLVTATRSELGVFEAPYMADVVGQQQWDRRAYRTTPQALRDVPGVMVQETAVGHGSPYIRGFTSFRNLFLIDGIRLNNSVFRPGPNQYWNTVDPEMIDRLEVVKGPSSVLYGSDAIGGTVNALTTDPYAYDRPNGVAGRGYYRFATAEESHTVRGEVSAAYNGELGFVGGGTYRNFGDLEGGEDTGEQPGTGYSEWHFNSKFEYFIQDNVRIVAAHQITRQNNVPRTERTIDAVSFAGTSVGNELRRELDQERQLAYVQLHAEQLDGFIQELHASVSWQRQAEIRDRIRQMPVRQDFTGFDVNTLGLFVTARSQTPIGDLVYGLDYYRDWVQSRSSSNSIQGPVADDSTYDLLGVFVQNTIHVTDSLDVILGGRFTYAAANVGRFRDEVDDGMGGTMDVVGSFEDSWTNFSGNARFVWFVDEARHWNVFGGASQGFRAPNLSDLTRDSDFSGGVEQPAPDLDAERYLMLEIGGKAQYDNFTGQASFFHYLIEDQVLRVPGGLATENFVKINADNGFMQGIELGAAWRFLPELTLFGNFSYIDGEIQSIDPATGTNFDDFPSRLPPTMGQIGLRYESNNLPIWAEGLVRMAADADRLSLRDQGDTRRIPPGGTPGYVVGSIRAGFTVQERIDVTLGIENISDEDYRVHGSGHNMPGRNLVIAVEARF